MFARRMKLQPFRLIWCVLICESIYAPVVVTEAMASDSSLLLYIGTYTGAKSKGIYVSRLDAVSGKLSSPELAAETKSPSFLAVHPNRRFLYAAGEMSTFAGQKAGAVSASVSATVHSPTIRLVPR